jgi:hypothetical protein
MRHGELAHMVFGDRSTRVHMVEVAHLSSAVAVRDSRRRGVAKLLVRPGAWSDFVAGLREGGSGTRCFGNGLSGRISSPIVYANAPWAGVCVEVCLLCHGERIAAANGSRLTAMGCRSR